MTWPTALSRRALLRTTTYSAGMLALSRLRPVRVAAGEAVAEAQAGYRVLTAREAAILAAIGDRIANTGDPTMPRFNETEALKTIDLTLVQLDAGVRRQFRAALMLFEYGPIVFQLILGRFTDLGDEERDAHIQSWRTSRLAFRRLTYGAMKNISFLGYYSQDSTWKGIHYKGPWLPRPRRVVPE